MIPRRRCLGLLSAGAVGSLTEFETDVLGGPTREERPRTYTVDDWTQVTKLVADDGDQGDNFGVSVSLAGEAALVGASSAGGGTGAVYVFIGTGGDWTRRRKLTAGDSSAARFGSTVDVSGEMVLVGANTSDTPSAEGTGAANVFDRSDGWRKDGKLVPEDGEPFDYFGEVVALDGDTALVGAPEDDNTSGDKAGALYGFRRSDSDYCDSLPPWRPVSTRGASELESSDTPRENSRSNHYESGWSRETKVVSEDGGSFDNFGSAIALSGRTAIVGAPSANRPNQGGPLGVTYVYDRDGGEWSNTATLIPPDRGGYFGWAVALEGNTVVVGDTDSDSGGTSTGAAHVFVREDGGWTHRTKLTARESDRADLVGSSVGLAGDTALVGARKDEDPNGEGAGAAYVFQRKAGAWTRDTKLVASDCDSDDCFGWSGAITESRALVGAWTNEDPNGDSAGSAYVFDREGERTDPEGRGGTRSPTGTATATATATDEDTPVDRQTDGTATAATEATTGGGGEGFGIMGALAGLGTAGYLLKRRLDSEESDDA